MPPTIVPLGPAVVGIASAAPPFKPPSSHPIVLIGLSQSGLLKVAFISHTFDTGDVVVPVTRSNLPSAYLPPAPIRSESSAVIVKGAGRLLVLDCVIDGDRLKFGEAIIEVTRRVRIPDAEWMPFKLKVWRAVGWIT